MSVIVIAFDGMDKELIGEYGLENVVQEEFGSIENSKNITRRMTSELFTSLITGKTDHGVEGLKKRELNNRLLSGIEDRIQYTIVDYKTKGLRTALYKAFNQFEYVERKYTKDDYDEETIFDTVAKSKPLFVPGYNPEYKWVAGLPNLYLEKGYSREFVAEKAREYTEERLDEFWNLTFGFWDLIFLHLHDPDTQQDIGITSLKKDYLRLDNIAGRIVEELGENHTIIFLSDHGLPERFEHNEHAFYSSNCELFGHETPHITDFHDRILELVNEK